MIATRVLQGAELAGVLDDVARLRIAVFRDWPYLYDGDPDYERRYLERYRISQGAIVVGAFDGDTLIGAATGTPMEDHATEFAAPFAETGLALSDVFYCAESVLLSAYRGRGLGHAFFDAREAHARDLGRRYAASAACSAPPTIRHALQPGGRWTPSGAPAGTSRSTAWWPNFRGGISATRPTR